MVGGEFRNTPCSCGSGKKTKKCCLGRKQVDYSIIFEFAELTEVKSYIQRADGRFSVETSNGATPVAQRYLNHYNRKKGQKTLIQVPLSELTIKRDGHLDQLSIYKTIYFIDTNTKLIENVRVSISSIILAAMQSVGELEYKTTFVPVCFFEIHECTGPQEAFAITVLQTLIASGVGYIADNKIAIVNDASLRDHGGINARKTPIYDDKLLLPNADLIYASTDSGADILNQLLKVCDKLSSTVLRQLAEAGLKHGIAKAVTEGHCTRFGLHWNRIVGPFPEDLINLGARLPLTFA